VPWEQGTDLGYLRELLAYWAGGFDWRAQERWLNGFRHFRTEIDGIGVHFVHERPRSGHGIPLILTHGIDHYIVPRIGRMRLQALRPVVISKLYRDLTEHGGRDGQPLSATTVSHVHRTLRKALADAVQVEQLLTVNPAARSKRPRNPGAEPTRVWTAEQLHAFLTDAQPHRLFAFYRLAAYTGARRGELLYLRWHAIDLDAAEVTFGGSTAVVRGQRVEGTTKGGRSRTVSLDSETIAILREHHRQQAVERLAAGSAWNDNGGLVFT
jgi:integrase